MRRSRAIAAVICGGLVFLAAGLRMDVSGTGLARLVIFGVAIVVFLLVRKGARVLWPSAS